MPFEEKIVERNLKASHVFIATFIGKMAEGGFLNKGVLNLVIPSVAEKLAEYLKFRYETLNNSDVSVEEKIKKTLEILKGELDPFAKYVVSINGNKINIAIESSKCKFCPKGVGGAEIPGILCMFPMLIKGILEGVTGEKFEVNIPVIKKEGYCIFQLSKKIGDKKFKHLFTLS